MHLLLACNPACSSSGVMRCFNRLASGCCNYYENNMCVISCTFPQVPDVNFDCGKSPCAHHVRFQYKFGESSKFKKWLLYILVLLCQAGY